jgi:hypothetical protein
VTAFGDGQGAARVVVAGALTTALGLAVAATAPIFGTAPIDRIERQQTAGGLVIVLGWVILAWGIHRYGRS